MKLLSTCLLFTCLTSISFAQTNNNSDSLLKKQIEILKLKIDSLKAASDFEGLRNKKILDSLQAIKQKIILKKEIDSLSTKSQNQGNNESASPISKTNEFEKQTIDTIYYWYQHKFCDTTIKHIYLTKTKKDAFTLSIQKISNNLPIKKDSSKNKLVDSLQNLVDSITKVTTKETIVFMDEVKATEVSKWLNKYIKQPCANNTNETISEEVVDRVRKNQINKEIDLLKKEALQASHALDSLMDVDRVAGVITLNKEIPLEIKNKNRSIIKKDAKLVIYTDNARIQTDYNRISDISFPAKLIYDGKEYDLGTLSNEDFSLTFIGLRQRIFTLELPIEPDNFKFTFNYSDVINYKPSEENYSSIIRNGSYKISNSTPTKIFRRSFGDYLSFRTFLDPLGFLGKNANGFAQLEGDLGIPIRLANLGKKWNYFTQVKANFSYTYSNTLNNEPRIIPSYLFRNTNDTTTNTLPLDTTSYNTSAFISNISIPQYSYYQFYAKVSLFSFEWKRANSWIHLESGIRVNGSRIYTQIANGKRIDTSTEKIHQLMPEFSIRMEFRPDYIIGGDISFGASYIGKGHLGNNLTNSITNPSYLYKARWIFPHEVNFYAYTGRSGKGGLFFRYIGWLSFNPELSEFIKTNGAASNRELAQSNFRKTSYFPQILIGYSTNLSTLIKRANKSDN